MVVDLEGSCTEATITPEELLALFGFRGLPKIFRKILYGPDVFSPDYSIRDIQKKLSAVSGLPPNRVSTESTSIFLQRRIKVDGEIYQWTNSGGNYFLRRV